MFRPRVRPVQQRVVFDEAMIFRRRTFVIGALSLPAASLAGRLTMPSEIRSEGAGSILLVSDANIPEARRFSRYWPSGTARMLSFERDVSALLFGQLMPMWRQGSVVPIAGLTDVRAFFCLSHAAGDYGLRLTYRSVRGRTDGSVSQHATRQDVFDWPSQTARAVKEALDTVRGQALSISELLPDRDEMLVSWLMVPRGRVPG